LLFFFFHRKKVVKEAEQKVKKKKKKKKKVGVTMIPDKQGGVFDFQDTCVGEDSTVLSLAGSIS
jgi:F0F1-type ATP synthase gamma subunit